MQAIEILLRKYAAMRPRDSIVKEAFRSAFIDEFGVNITIPELSVTRNSIRVHVSGPLKSEIFIRKESLEKTFLQYMEKGFWLGDVR